MNIRIEIAPCDPDVNEGQSIRITGNHCGVVIAIEKDGTEVAVALERDVAAAVCDAIQREIEVTA